LEPLGQILANPAVQKVFHAAEYDLILLKREYGWELHNLFDTMWASRILGYQRYGLANMLGQLYGVKLDKRFQKSDWCKRPLTSAQLQYAQLDTHYLLQLRHDLHQQLADRNLLEEATETFVQQSTIQLNDQPFNPDNFWNLNGARDLTRRQQAILKELFIYREQVAQRSNQPLFKILSDRTLMELAQLAPETMADLSQVHGMSSRQIQRRGSQVLQAVQRGLAAPFPSYPPRNRKRTPDAVLNRYEKLHNWRKETAVSRGVESDVIVSRQALWDIAGGNPANLTALAKIKSIGEWRCQLYGEEILAILAQRRTP
jgi:ribonuclease D